MPSRKRSVPTTPDELLYRKAALLLEHDPDLREILHAFDLANEEYDRYLASLMEPEQVRPSNTTSLSLGWGNVSVR